MALRSIPRPKDLRSLILILLHEKPKGMLAEHLNNRLKDFSWHEINEELKLMLKDNIIAVTAKRFWARDPLSHYPRKVS